MVYIKLFLLISIISALSSIKCDEEIDELEILIDILKKNVTNNRIGFLTDTNYYSVRRVLPLNVKPVFITHKEDLTQMVLNGSLVAGLVTGMPEQIYHDSLHIFSSTIVTLHSILMAPDRSNEQPHGVNETLSTTHLALAVDAAITRIQSKGIDDYLAIKNSPKEIVHAHTCKDDDRNQFPLPNKANAKGLLKDVLENRKLKVLGIGPSNWGDNDGNYLVNPPTGFYPDLLSAIVEQFKNLSGADKVPYGEITIERVYPQDRGFPWYKLFDGSAHITEPYFILDSAYGGSGKPCETDNDCLDSDLPTGKERCISTKTCYYPPRPRISMLRSSCTAVGTDSKFFTKRKNQNQDIISSSNSMSGGLIALIVILSLICILTLSFVGLLFYRKAIDKSTFYKLFK